MRTELPNFTIRKKKPAMCFDSARFATPPMHSRSRKLQASPVALQPHVAGSISSTIALVTSPNRPGRVRAQIREPNPSQHGRAQGSGHIGSSSYLLPIRVPPPMSTPRDAVSLLCSWIPSGYPTFQNPDLHPLDQIRFACEYWVLP